MSDRDFSGLDTLPLADLQALALLTRAGIAALSDLSHRAPDRVAHVSIDQDDGVWLLTVEVPEAER